MDFLEPTFSTEELIEKTDTILGKTLFSGPPKEREPAALQAVRGKEKKRSALLLPAVGIMLVLGIAGAGYMAYQQFMPTQKGTPSLAAKTPVRAPSVAPKTGLKPQLPPASNVADTTVQVSSVPSIPPVQPPAQPSPASSENVSQPPHKPFYSVQLGAFRDEEMAQVLTKKFQEKGYGAFTQPGVTKDRSPIYRELVNKYEDRKAAQKMAGEIQTGGVLGRRAARTRSRHPAAAQGRAESAAGACGRAGLSEVALVVLALLILFWAVARLHLRVPDLCAFDQPTGQHFSRGPQPSGEHGAVVASLGKVSGVLKGVPRRQHIAVLRRFMDELFPASDVAATITPADAGGVPAEWVLAPGADGTKRVLYIHGGAFTMGSPKSHRRLTAKFSEINGGAVLAIDYRLMPEHRRMAGIRQSAPSTPLPASQTHAR